MLKKVMRNGVGCLNRLLLCGALFAMGCGGLEPHDSTSINGKAEVFDEQMAGAMMPKVWDVNIHPDGYLLASGVLGRIFIDFDDNGDIGVKVTGPNNEYLSMEEEKYIVIGFLDEMKAHMLTEEQLRVNASAIQEAMDIQDGDAIRFLAKDEDVMMGSVLTLMGLGAALLFPTVAAVATGTAVVEGTVVASSYYASIYVNFAAGLAAFQLSLNEQFEYSIADRVIDGWLRLGKCSQHECEISQADAGM